MREYTLWKEKGEYPVDEEGVLYISPYWKQTMNIAENKRKPSLGFFHKFAILYIICVACYTIYWIIT